MSIELDELPCQLIMSTIEWPNENNRNELGTLCAIARTLRDWGYEIKEKKMLSEETKQELILTLLGIKTNEKQETGFYKAG